MAVCRCVCVGVCVCVCVYVCVCVSVSVCVSVCEREAKGKIISCMIRVLLCKKPLPSIGQIE